MRPPIDRATVTKTPVRIQSVSVNLMLRSSHDHELIHLDHHLSSPVYPPSRFAHLMAEARECCASGQQAQLASSAVLNDGCAFVLEAVNIAANAPTVSVYKCLYTVLTVFVSI
jgi:CO dehydrogenase/acetyl-CoA synthase gamma subunit (corrinoid Fe-S protein)